MYMRIIWGRLRPGQWEPYEETYKRVLGPHRGIAGLKGRWLVRDAADPDAGYSVSLWASPEDMRAYERSDLFNKTVKPALQPFFANDFTTTHCEVRVMEQFGG
jgi:heme-degrading monooxygenase HmoA